MNTSLFGNTQFLKLWGNQLLLQIAFNMCNYSALLILANQKNDPSIQAIFYTALTLPALVFGFIAGPTVDLVNRKKLILICDILLALLLFSYSFFYENFLLLLALAFLTSSVARFFIPAEAATIPLIVKKDDLKHANTIFLFTLLGSVLLGYALAVPVMGFFGGLGSRGEVAPFIVGSICVVLGFFLMQTIGRISQPKIKESGLNLVEHTFFLFFETVNQIKGNTKISIPLLLLLLAELVVGIMSVVLFEYVRTVLMLPLATITVLLLLPLLAGISGGLLLIERIKKIYQQKELLITSVFCMGVSFLAMGALPFFLDDVFFLQVAALIEAFIIGICFVTIAVESRTLLQTQTPPKMQGRVFSFLDIMIALTTPIPVLIVGFTARGFGLLQTLVSFGVVVLGIGLIGYKWGRR